VVWAQACVSFVVWCLAGVWIARRMLKADQAPHPAVGAFALIGGALLLVAGLVGVGTAHGLVAGSLVPWAWLAVTLLGVAFVALQAWGALAIASRAFRRETGRAADPSVAKKDPS